MTLLLERQMKNIWVGVSVPMEHRQTTTDLSAISTEALFQYQIVFFWHTECYLVTRQTSALLVKQYSCIPFSITAKPYVLPLLEVNRICIISPLLTLETTEEITCPANGDTEYY